MGVVLVVVEAELVVGFTGVFLIALAGFDAEAVVALVSFLTAVGNGFFAPAVAGFEASLTGFAAVTGVFLTGVVVVVGFEAAETGFLVADVAAGVAVDVDAPAALSFLGAFFTGGVAVLVVVVAGAAGFLTGAALVADDVAFAGVAVVGFFVA